MKTTMTVTYSVDKCTHERFNGEHTETFDLSKLSDDDLEQYIAQCLIIKRQSQLRSKGACGEDGSSKITLGTWVVPAPGKRVSTSPVTKISDLMSKLTPDQMKAFREMMLAKLEEEEN